MADNALTPGKGTDDELHPPRASSVPKLSLPGSDERRRSSYGVYTRAVLCAVDPSDHSRDAFEWFLSNIWRSDDLIVLVYCPETPSLPSFSFKQGLTPPTDLWQEILKEASAKTKKLEEEYEAICIEKKLRYKVRGESFKKPGEGIIKIAEDEKVNLIVMGSRGLSKIQRFMIGSVSEYVVRNTRVPCVIVPAEKD